MSLGRANEVARAADISMMRLGALADQGGIEVFLVKNLKRLGNPVDLNGFCQQEVRESGLNTKPPIKGGRSDRI